MQMKKRMQQLFLPVLLGALLLGACQSKSTKPAGQVEPEQYRVAIELVTDDETLADSLLARLGKTELECFRWKNHLVLFGDAKDTVGIAERIRDSYIRTRTNVYDSPLYAFNRAQHCGDSVVPKPWRNYLLTANLVADSVMQKEYMHYHEVQFDEWPEVALGFCRADFQQLLVYRSGRQLMLVISIPSDKTLDELNPKTEENNPRVVEWNRLMGNYQEGIEGTEPGETWVFLNPVDAELDKINTQ